MPKQIRSHLTHSLLLFAISISTNINADQQQQDNIKNIGTAPPISNGNLETYHLIQQIFNDKLSSNDKRIKELELKIIAQEDKAKRLELKTIAQEAQINELKREISAPPPSQDSFTTTIVLAAVTVIVTVLGVLIAILSIFGYANIKKESIKASQETAQKTIGLIADDGLLQATEKSLLILMEKGRFDEIIHNSISLIEYRGISVESDLLDEEEQH